jgi:hypothetical protein
MYRKPRSYEEKQEAHRYKPLVFESKEQKIQAMGDLERNIAAETNEGKARILMQDLERIKKSPIMP